MSNGGTMLAMLRTTKASPGWKSKMWEGHTLESEQANTINCMCTIIISHRIVLSIKERLYTMITIIISQCFFSYTNNSRWFFYFIIGILYIKGPKRVHHKIHKVLDTTIMVLVRQGQQDLRIKKSCDYRN